MTDMRLASVTASNGGEWMPRPSCASWTIYLLLIWNFENLLPGVGTDTPGPPTLSLCQAS